MDRILIRQNQTKDFRSFSNICLLRAAVRRNRTVLVFDHPRDWFEARYVRKKIVRYARMSGDLRLFAGREWLPIVDSFNCLWRQSYAA
jgi:hypothetical protein